ncbi:MAG: glycosyltransferase family 2 protein [Acidimicrobiales bacterium]
MVRPRDTPVTILLSVHNGVPWLPELVDSIRRQTHQHWTLVVRDDGSDDDSPMVLQRLAEDESRIRIVEIDGGNLGPPASFMTLLQEVDGEVFAFCDQDDVWHPDKLRRSLSALAEDPVAAVYTDAMITDARGTVTAPSAMAIRGSTSGVPFGHLVVNNAAIGATMLGTPELASRALALAGGDAVLMHDWWVALVAAYEGSLTYLSEPTLQWRRHDLTVTGATPSGSRPAPNGAGLPGMVDRGLSTAGGRREPDHGRTRRRRRLRRPHRSGAPEDPRPASRLAPPGVRAWPVRSSGPALGGRVVECHTARPG